jgi:hypothetical protein
VYSSAAVPRAWSSGSDGVAASMQSLQEACLQR